MASKKVKAGRPARPAKPAKAKRSPADAAMEAQLLDAIRAEPDVRDNYVVYGDWLAERGEPHGELIGLSAGLAHAGDDRKLAARVAKLQAAQRAQLPRSRVREVGWKLGFIAHARLDVHVGASLATLLAHPLLALVESLELVGMRPAELVDALPGRVPLLRALAIGSRERTVLASAEPLRRLLAAHPRLCDLTLRACELPDGCIELLAPIARRLELELDDVSAAQLLAIGSAKWPRLEALVLRVPSDWTEGDDKQWPLAKLLAGKTAPRLVELRLLEDDPGDLTERFAAEIVKAPLLPRLEVLDFSLRRADVEALRAEYPRLAHVRELLPSAEHETDADTLGSLVWFFDELQPERSVELARRGLELAETAFDRHSIGKQYGAMLAMVGRLEEGLEALHASLAIDDDCGMTWIQVAIAQRRAGRLDEARVAIERAEASRQHRAERHSLLFNKGAIASARGDTATATAAFADALPLFRAELTRGAIDADLHFEYACLLALLGDGAGALDSLATCLARSAHYQRWAQSEPAFAVLHDTPAFWALVR